MPHSLQVGAIYVAPTPSGTGTALDINYDAAGTETTYVTGLKFDYDGVGITSYIPTRSTTESRTEDLVNIAREEGI